MIILKLNDSNKMIVINKDDSYSFFGSDHVNHWTMLVHTSLMTLIRYNMQFKNLNVREEKNCN